MKLYKRLSALFTVLLIVSLTLTALAHDAWVEPAKGPLFHILYGHKTPEAYDIAKVTSLKIFNAKKNVVTYNRITRKDGVDIKAGGTPALFMLEFNNGYWLKDSTGESHNLPTSQIPAGTDPLHALKFSKTIISWQPWMLQPQGQRIEFVPVGITGIPRAGSQLKLQLLVDGKPVSGQMVENNSNEEGPKTDAIGYVTVTVLKGINRFATDYFTTQDNDPVARRLGLTPALVFMAK